MDLTQNPLRRGRGKEERPDAVCLSKDNTHILTTPKNIRFKPNIQILISVKVVLGSFKV
jgi:hypothetical protein